MESLLKFLQLGAPFDVRIPFSDDLFEYDRGFPLNHFTEL